MNPEQINEIEDFLRSMRQAFNSRDMKSYRAHFWTNPKFIHLDASGRLDHGWGEFEEVLDQEFRYLDSCQLTLKDLRIQLFDGAYSSVVGVWKLVQVDPSGHEQESHGRMSYSLVKFGKTWKIVTAHYATTAEQLVE